MDLAKVDNIEFDGVDYKDYPDFTDAFICSADYDGKPMTEDQLDELNDHDDFVYNELINQIF